MHGLEARVQTEDTFFEMLGVLICKMRMRIIQYMGIYEAPPTTVLYSTYSLSIRI